MLMEVLLNTQSKSAIFYTMAWYNKIGLLNACR